MSSEYVAVTGDAVASRRLTDRARARLQEALAERLAVVNRRWRKSLAARFGISVGDEFQGLLVSAAPLWEIAHWLRAELPEVDWIVAAGRGTISTGLAKLAPQVDGPCLHRARAALDRAKRERLLFGFEGFEGGETLDALARYYSALYWGWTARQRRAAKLLRVMPAADAARALRIGRSAVSHLTRRLRWRLVSEADRVFRECMTEGAP